MEKIDYRFTINVAVLDALTGGDDHIIDELSNEAITEMKSYLNARYDVDAIFNAVGDARDKTILMYCKDLALYHIFSYRSYKIVPENRMKRYEKALQWLEDVCKQKINPEGLTLNTKSFVKTGSNDKRINQQQ
ncbi:MAG: phage protein Gp36 family protein [Bacteroidota bacterium]